MLPPLRDAHLHLAAHGEELSCINLSQCASQAECLSTLASAAAHRPHNQWLKAVAARIEAWPERAYPTTDQLREAIGNDIPAVILSFDHHALVASPAALRAAGIDPDSSNPPEIPGGLIELRDGKPTGLLLESAANHMRATIPAPTHDQLLQHLRAAITDLTRQGFIEVHDMLSRPELGTALLELESNGELPLTVWLYPLHEHFDIMHRQSKQWESEQIKLAGLKIFTDGTLNSRTAHMLTDYLHPIPSHPRGTPLLTPHEIESAIRFADSRGYPIAAHAIGDAAVRAVLDAIERTAPQTLGHRIEHAQFIDEQDIPRFAHLGVVASMQPCHLLTDIEAINRFMPHRAHRAFPLRDLIEASTKTGFEPQELLWLGSDTPIVPPNPSDNIQAATHRRRQGMPPSQSIAPNQSITEQQTITCYASQFQRNHK